MSVIVPVFNTEKYLKNCLDSLAAQTLTDIEVIIVNDGSTDNSLTIAEDAATKFPWFHVYTTKNQGVSCARNFGAYQSHGDYLAFVDSDDTVDPNYCKLMYEKAVRDHNDLVVCQFDRITISDGKEKREVPPSAIFALDNFNLREHRQLLADINVGPWDKLINRSLFKELHFPEGIRYAEDQVHTIKAFCLAQNIGTVRQVLYHYYYEIHGGVTSGFGRERLDWIAVMNQLYGFMQEERIRPVFSSELEYFMVAKSIRMCSAITVRTNLSKNLRTELVQGICTFLREKFPDWRHNPYYIQDVKKRVAGAKHAPLSYRNGKRVRLAYCNYGEKHLLALVHLSDLLSPAFYNIVFRADQHLFSAFRKIRWGIIEYSDK